MAVDINTIITNFQPLYPANKQQIWSRLKDDNPSLTDEIITHLSLSIEESKFTITVTPTTTEYEGEINHLSYQYNLYIQIDGGNYYVYDFNQFCSTGNFNVHTNVGDRTFTINSRFTAIEFIENPSINFINNNFLYYCAELNFPFITIPNGITTIGNNFLSNCITFNSPLTLSNSLVSIGDRFMEYCIRFNSPLTLSNSLISIGNSFMSYCEVFNQPLIIPNSVTTIGNNFLSNCKSFNSPLTLSNSLVSIPDDFMSYCEVFNQPLIIPNSVTTIGNNFLWTSSHLFDSPLTLSDSLVSIGNSFLYHKNFNQPLIIPNSVTTIGNNFLSDCNSFNQSLTLSNRLTSIGKSFLRGCSSFNQPLTLPGSLTSIGADFMFNCDNFNQPLIISSSITPQMFSDSSYTFATSNSSAIVYTEGFKIKYNKFSQLLQRFPNSNTNPYRNIVEGPLPQTSFIAKETSLSYKYHLNLVLGEHDIKVYLVKENEVSMEFDKPITTILPDTSTGKLLIGNALKNLPADQLTETAIETKITAINFYNK